MNRRFRWSALGAVGAVVAAASMQVSCAVGPNYRRPSAPVPSAYKELPPGWKVSTPKDERDRGDWWSIFSDPELDELERQVVISNQNVKQYEAEYAQAVALLKEAQAQLFPTVAVNGGEQRAGGGGGGTTSVSSTVGGSGTTSVSNTVGGGHTHTQFSLEAAVSWQPDIWGSVRRQIESRKAGVQVSRADLANAQLSAQATLATDYFDLTRYASSSRRRSRWISGLSRSRRISSTPEPRPTAMSRRRRRPCRRPRRSSSRWTSNEEPTSTRSPCSPGICRPSSALRERR